MDNVMVWVQTDRDLEDRHRTKRMSTVTMVTMIRQIAGKHKEREREMYGMTLRCQAAP